MSEETKISSVSPCPGRCFSLGLPRPRPSLRRDGGLKRQGKGLYVGAPGRPPKVCLFNVGASSIGFGGVSGAELIGGKLWPVPMPPVGLVLVVGTELAVGGGLLGADFS